MINFLMCFFSDNSGTFLVCKGLVKLSGSFKEERLPILVGDAERNKLLGLVKYPKGSGSDGMYTEQGEIIALINKRVVR